MHCLAPGLYSRYTTGEMKNVLKQVDLVIVDLDECIFPGITKVTASIPSRSYAGVRETLEIPQDSDFA